MHGSHGQVPVNIYLETGENATNTIIFQQKHAASQFRKFRWIRKVLISMVDMWHCMFNWCISWQLLLVAVSVAPFFKFRNKQKMLQN
jgi:hypothetical protein